MGGGGGNHPSSMREAGRRRALESRVGGGKKSHGARGGRCVRAAPHPLPHPLPFWRGGAGGWGRGVKMAAGR